MSKPIKVAICRKGRTDCTIWHRLDEQGNTLCREYTANLLTIKTFASRKAAADEYAVLGKAQWCARCNGQKDKR